MYIGVIQKHFDKDLSSEMTLMHAGLLTENCEFLMGSLGGILLWVV